MKPLSLAVPLALAALAALACDGGAPPVPDAPTPGEPAVGEDELPLPEYLASARGVSADAKIETHAMLLEDQAAPRHPSDGGGRAWLVDGEPRPRFPAGSRQRLEMVYEAGPLGVAEGGAVYLQPTPFWEWDPPQASFADAPGFTTVKTAAEGVSLELDDRAGEILVIRIGGRALQAGERLQIVYGAGPARTRVDSYAEDGTRIYLAVDGDGDGVRAMVDELPALDVVASAPARLQCTLPSSAAPGEALQLTVAVLDARGNAGVSAAGELSVAAVDGLTLPATLRLEPAQGGVLHVPLQASSEGVYQLDLAGRGALEGIACRSNALLVRAAPPRVLWADLHGHSQLSDGTGMPDQYFAYARDVSALDVAVLTDHDHWGMRFLDTHPELWSRIRASVRRHHEPGRFVTLLGYEWTSWLHGHRHVLYFSESADAPPETGAPDEWPIFSSIDPRYDDPLELWDALRGRDALTFAHHSAGGPISTNWRYLPDPELEPVTEIVSVHGSSEAMDSPDRIYSPVPGNFVRDALDAGYRFGFVGSGDSHDGHPGLAQLAAPGGTGGLAALLTDDRTRAGVLAALRARRVYATNGARILLDVRIDGQPMGSALEPGGPADGDSQRLEIEIVGSAPVARLDLIRTGHTATLAGEGRSHLRHEREIPRLTPGEYHYVRVVQEDGGTAWSSPIFVPLPPTGDAG